MQTVYTFHIDLNERGYFNAHVENSRGNTVASFTNENTYIDENGEEVTEYGSFHLVEDGYMKHIEDMKGLKSWLVDMGIMKQNYDLEYCG